MNLGFKPKFVAPIMAGQKIHTIRKPSTRWKAGKKIHFATGMRTKDYLCFREGICKSVQEIKIRYDNKNSSYPAVIVDGVAHRVFHRPCVILQIAMNDGFKNIEDFCEWFDSDFTGILIHWTDRKY